MAIYTVHLKPNAASPLETIQLVKEGFSWGAAFFSILWAIYYRVWIVMLVILALHVTLSSLEVTHLLSEKAASIIDSAFVFWLGWEAGDFLRHALKKQGYIMVDIVNGKNSTEAMERFLTRYATTV